MQTSIESKFDTKITEMQTSIESKFDTKIDAIEAKQNQIESMLVKILDAIKK